TPDIYTLDPQTGAAMFLAASPSTPSFPGVAGFWGLAPVLQTVPEAETALSFSSAVATFYQPFQNWSPSQMIDGDFSAINGWAIWRGGGIADPTLSETALLTFSSPLPAGHHFLTFKLYQLHDNPGHSLGDFSLGYATTGSPTLASAE